MPGDGAAADPGGGPAPAGDPRLRRPGRGAAAPPGAHRRGVAAPPPSSAPCCRCCSASSPTRPSRTGGCSPTGRSPTRSARTPWYLRLLRDEGPVALRLARLLGARPGTRPTCWPASRRRCGCWPTTPSWCPRPRESLCEGFAAAAAGRHADPVEASRAVRALRRRELFRIACADLLGRAGGLAPAARRWTSSRSARAGRRHRRHPRPPRCAPPGRRAGAARACGSPSSAWAGSAGTRPTTPPTPTCCSSTSRRPGWPRTTASAAAHAIAEELRRLLVRARPRPAAGRRRRPAPGGPAGPAGAQPRRVRSSTTPDWSKIWEAQALLRARFVCGDADLAHRFLAMADRGPLPGRRADPRAGRRDPPDQGAGGHRAAAPGRRPGHPHQARPGRPGRRRVGGAAAPAAARGRRRRRCATPRTLDALAAARDAGLVVPTDAVCAGAGLDAGRAGPQRADAGPRPAERPAAPARAWSWPAWRARWAGRPDEPGEFLDEYLRTARRSRAAMERVLES